MYVLTGKAKRLKTHANPVERQFVKNIFYVYAWIRKDTNRIFYVGKGHGNRYKDLSSRNDWFLHTVNKVGMENIEIKILEDNLDEETSFEREKFYIKKYRDEGQPLTNLTDGGDGSGNWYQFLSEEEKEKHREISKSFLGKKHTEETKEKMRKAAAGRKHTEETKKKLSEYYKLHPNRGFLGHHVSEENKKLIAEIQRKRCSKKILVFNEQKELIKTFDSFKNCLESKEDNINDYMLRCSVLKNRHIKNISDLVQAKNKLYYIYEEDYNKLQS